MLSTEMDKSGDVRHGTNRLSRQQINTNNKKERQQQQKQSRPNLFFGFDGGVGDGIGLEKAKKEKIRRLSSVNGNRGSLSPCPSPNSNQHCETEMGSSCCCDLSSDNRENQCPSHSQHSPSLITNSTITKRFKIPKKFFDDCNVVDQASVPRKLRSAMKKRGHESISPPIPDSKKLNHTLGGVESHKKDGAKKPKLNLKGESDWSRMATVSGPITKDEEEVVETLYALAGMFPDGDSMDKNKLSGESIEVKSSALPEKVESPATEIEVKKDDTNSVYRPQAAENVPSSIIDESSAEAAKLNSLNEPTTQDQLDLPGSKRSLSEPDSSISLIRLNDTNIHVLSKLSVETELKQPKQQVTDLFERKPEIAFGVVAIESQMVQKHMIKEPRNNGLALWPGLSSTVPLTARSPGSLLSSATKIPAWLDATTHGPSSCSVEAGSSTEEVSRVTMDRKSMKRCAAHVYISCLIRNQQTEDSKESDLQQPLQLKPHVGLKQMAGFDPNDCRNLRNDINGPIPCSISGNSVTARNSNEARSCILQPKMVHQEQSQVASASGIHTSHRKSVDFLSLSTGGVNTEANNSCNKDGDAIESLAQHHVPYLRSLPQQQALVSLSMLPSRYTSSAYTDQLSTSTAAQQVQLQLPQYVSNHVCGPPYTSVAKQQQQQQRLWAAHLAAQYRPGGTSAVLTQFPSWQNGKPESSTLIPCAQSAVPPHSTLDAVGTKYDAVPQYQHPKIAISSSLPPARVKRPDFHIPSVYEESGGGFRAGGPLPLQLLCNKRH